MTEHDAPSPQQRLDELRRRLYGPDASEADRLEHAALLEQVERAERPGPDLPTPAPEPAPGPVARRRAPVLALGISGALAVVFVAGVATQLARHEAAPSATAPISESVWAGASSPTAAPIPTPVALSRGGRSVPAQQMFGGGSAVVPLDTAAAPRVGGRLVVALTSSDPSPVGWLAERRRDGSQAAKALEVVASSPPALHQGRTAPTVVAYSGAPPSQLLVRAAAGTGWTLTVAFTR